MKPIYTPKGKALEYAPLALNLYIGCSHGCDYCYAPRQAHKKPEEFWGNPQPRKDVLKHLEKQLQSGEFKGKRVLLSFLSDPYHGLKAGALTRQALILFLEHGVNWNVLTKNALAEKDFNLYREGDKFGMSLTYDNSHDTSYHERNATNPFSRFRTLKEAWSRGIKTWASLEPVIEPDQTLKIIRYTVPYVDLYKIGKLNYRKSDVDWSKFVKDAVELLEKHGKKYILKESLKKYLVNS